MAFDHDIKLYSSCLTHQFISAVTYMYCKCTHGALTRVTQSKPVFKCIGGHKCMLSLSDVFTDLQNAHSSVL